MVNVLDVNATIPTPTPEKDRLQLIFERQHELMTKYFHIEKQNGLLETDDYPVNLHDRYGQARLKNFAWRCVEELAESMDALDHGNETHHFEEIADAYHFLVELMLLSGFTAEDFGDKPCRLEAMFEATEFPNHRPYMQLSHFTRELGMAMNCLKNKPWKQTHQLTDIPAYRARIIRAHQAFIVFCKSTDLFADALFRLYFAKSEVNKFRQRSNY